MEELKVNSFGLEWLFNAELHKSIGILNGIDNDVWNPSTDTYLTHHYMDDINVFKEKNKVELIRHTSLDPQRPLIAFIGRFAAEKGADLVPSSIISNSLQKGLNFNYIILGTGDKSVEQSAASLAHYAPDRVISHIMYDEKLSHQIYAGADFIIMPSRVEPCGLNQMYAMRYGTIPIVHNIGGLRDSVQYFDGENGTGIKFDNLNIYTILGELQKAEYLHSKKDLLNKARSNAMAVDLSWDKSAATYNEIYNSIISK
jgi:starch synthase